MSLGAHAPTSPGGAAQVGTTPSKRGVTAAAASNADIGEKVFLGLRWLGYKETEAKRAPALAFTEHAHGGSAAAEPLTVEALLKRTLALLGTTRPRA